MLYTNDLIEFIQKNRGKTIPYGNGYVIKVYADDMFQACISYGNNTAFLRTAQRCKDSIDIFLESKDKEGIIDYSVSCRLAINENISGLFNVFEGNPKLECALIALLELN